MADEFDIVDVWVGQFGSAVRAEEYFAETYGDEDSPISAFASDMRKLFYDHDFLEWGFFERQSQDLGYAIKPFSFSASYASTVEEAFKSIPPFSFNLILLVWNREITNPTSVRKPDVLLVYLGRFPCVPNAPSAAQ